jgi:hypothetical protein
MNLLLYLFLILGLSQAEICDELDTTPVSTLEKVNELWSWCLDDFYCTELFYQDHPNITVFNYLARPIVSEYDSLDSPYNDLFCNKTREEALQNLWYLILKANVDDTQICDINHVLVVDRDQLSSTCLCRGDKICKDISDHMTGMYVLVSLALFLALCINVSLIIKIKLQLDASRNPTTVVPQVKGKWGFDIFDVAREKKIAKKSSIVRSIFGNA